MRRPIVNYRCAVQPGDGPVPYACPPTAQTVHCCRPMELGNTPRMETSQGAPGRVGSGRPQLGRRSFSCVENCLGGAGVSRSGARPRPGAHLHDHDPGATRVSAGRPPPRDPRRRCGDGPLREPGDPGGPGAGLDHVGQHPRGLSLVPGGSPLGPGSPRRRPGHPPGAEQRVDPVSVGSREPGGQGREPAGRRGLPPPRGGDRAGEGPAEGSGARAAVTDRPGARGRHPHHTSGRAYGHRGRHPRADRGLPWARAEVPSARAPRPQPSVPTGRGGPGRGSAGGPNPRDDAGGPGHRMAGGLRADARPAAAGRVPAHPAPRLGRRGDARRDVGSPRLGRRLETGRPRPRQERDLPQVPEPARLHTSQLERPGQGASRAALMPPRPYILNELTWKDVGDARYEVAVLPWGACEPHSRHLPYSTDNVETERIAGLAARIAWERGARVVVLPVVPFGVNTGQLDLPLCLNLHPSTQALVLRDLATALAGQGVPKLVILNGHGGNDFRQMIRELQPAVSLLLCTVNWYQLVDAKPFFSDLGDHAGELETSVMLHMAPELVRPLSEAGPGRARRFKVTATRRRCLRSWARWTERFLREIEIAAALNHPH